MRRTMPFAIFGTLALVAVALAASRAQTAPTLELRLLETTDIHMNLVNYDYYQDKATDEYGLSRTATLIAQARAEVSNSLLFDNGDLIQGTPLGDYVAAVKPLAAGETHPAFKVLNLLGVDAGNIGNHEFNYGLPFMDKALAGAKFPMVNANVVKTGGQNAFTPYVILERRFKDSGGNEQPLKVGVIGFVPPQIMQWDRGHLEGKVTANDITETAQKFVPELRAKGVDLIIALAHSGFATVAPTRLEENAVAGLSRVAGIDAILFGHSHLEFPGATFKTFPGADIEKGTINGVPSVMPGFWGNDLGLIDLKLTRDGQRWKVTGAQSSLRLIYDRTNKKPLVASDPRVEDAVKTEHQATLEYVRGRVADLEAPINSYFALVQDDPSVQLVSNAQTWYVKRALQGTEYAQLPVLSAAAPFKAGGRSGPSYYTDIPAGTLAIKHIADLYIYPNTVKAVLVTGAQVKEWLERSAGQFRQIDPKGPANQPLVDESFPTYNFDVIDGVSYEIDVTQPSRYDGKGQIQNPNAERIKNLSFAGKPIDPAAKFVVATNNYRAGGGGSFPGLDGKNIILDAPDENRQAIIAYFTSLGKVNPSADGNWRLTPIPGLSVTFTSSPNATKYAPTNVKKAADRSDGFSDYTLTW